MKSMQRLAEGVFRVLPERLTPTKYSSFYVKHPDGNLMFPCYSRAGLAQDALGTIDADGGLLAQLLGDMHMKDPLCDVVQARYGAWTYCSVLEADDVKRSCSQVRSFPYRRHALFPHVEVIPTPGHRPGSVSYLVPVKNKRILFAGDNVGYDGKRWTAFPPRAGRAEMIKSLQMLGECEFDLLCAITLADEPTCSIELETAAKRKRFFDAVCATLDG
jgi:hydroxyacylglutathione hydrolase